jgi:formate hydrogenlyase subunit 3/multisubunit Na+/H+ antiporter MnhD subunit
MHHEVLLLVIPIAAAFLAPLVARRSRAGAEAIALCAYVGALAYAVALFPAVLGSPRAVIVAGWRPPLGIALFVSPLSLGAAALIYLTASLISVANLGRYGDGESPRGVPLRALFVLGAVGMVLTADLFNAFVFLEIAGIAAFALVAAGRAAGSGEGAEPWAASSSGALRYLVAAQVASLFMLLGMGLLYSATGLLTMPSLVAHPSLKPSFGLLTAVLVLFPILLEAKIVPLNFWAGRAYGGAPAGFAAALSGIGATAAAVLLLRLLSVMGPGSAFDASSEALRGVLLLLGALTVLAGETAAFREADLKKVLAWSSAGQMGVVLIGAALPVDAAAGWTLFFLMSHALAKTLLLLLAGFFAARAGDSRWEAMRGLGRAHPLAAGLFAAGALSLMGLPVFAGFWGKLGILQAAFASGVPGALAAAAILLGAVAEGVYFLRIAHRLFESPEAATEGAGAAAVETPAGAAPRRAPASLLIPALILAAAVLLLGLRPTLAIRVLAPAAQELASPDEHYARIILSPGAAR